MHLTITTIPWGKPMTVTQRETHNVKQTIDELAKDCTTYNTYFNTHMIEIGNRDRHIRVQWPEGVGISKVLLYALQEKHGGDGIGTPFQSTNVLELLPPPQADHVHMLQLTSDFDNCVISVRLLRDIPICDMRTAIELVADGEKLRPAGYNAVQIGIPSDTDGVLQIISWVGTDGLPPTDAPKAAPKKMKKGEASSD